MKIAIVGVCASGKTTLVAGLKAAGYGPTMWHRSIPAFIIFGQNIIRTYS